MESWTEEFEHESLSTPDTLNQARQTLSKFSTKDDAIVGYLELQKAAGKPFKLPESLDKLPSDEIRNEFISQTNKLFGAVENEEALKDINWIEGMPEGSKPNEMLKTAFTKFIIEKHMSKSLAQSLIGLNNQLSIQLKEAMANEKKQNLDKVKEGLLKVYNGEENLNQKEEIVRRMYQNDLGLSAAEFDKVVAEFDPNDIEQSIILRKAIINAAEKISKEGTTEGGGGEGGAGGTKKESKYEQYKRMWPTRPELWGNPNE